MFGCTPCSTLHPVFTFHDCYENIQNIKHEEEKKKKRMKKKKNYLEKNKKRRDVVYLKCDITDEMCSQQCGAMNVLIAFFVHKAQGNERRVNRS